MPKPIQTFPLGLQSLLQVKGNLSPLDLNDNIQLTLESFQFLALQRQEVAIFAGVATAAVGPQTFPDSLVPPGETWYVWTYHISGLLAAGNTLKVQPSVITPGNLLTIPLQLSQAYVALERFKLASTGPMVIQGGAAFGYDVGIITGAAISINGGAWITRLRT